jgi:hypothetical protein
LAREQKNLAASKKFSEAITIATKKQAQFPHHLLLVLESQDKYFPAKVDYAVDDVEAIVENLPQCDLTMNIQSLNRARRKALPNRPREVRRPEKEEEPKPQLRKSSNNFAPFALAVLCVCGLVLIVKSSSKSGSNGLME